MLSEAENKLFTQVSAGTPMGELLRRHWMPVAGTSEFDSRAIKPVRLLGEDLVLYKDLSGRYGMLERQCAHRRADLAYGCVEKHGLRCNYHGWCYEADGRCVEMPYEDTAYPDRKMKERIAVRAYPVEEKVGMLWVYMGPQPAPLVPDWEPFSRKNGFVQVVLSDIPCNWFQCQENSIDPVHFEWMHDNWQHRLAGGDAQIRPSTHKKLEFEEFEYGFVYRRLRGDATEDSPLWTIGRVLLWPLAFYLGGHIEWRVPVDDENTLSVTWAYTRVPREQEPYVQKSIPTWYGPIVDPQTGRWISSHVMNQDFIAWVGQGKIADRTKEQLMPSDRGIALMRRRFLQEIEAMKAGAELKAVIRDRARNVKVELPAVLRDYFDVGLTRQEMHDSPYWRPYLTEYILQAGQPADVRADYIAAMGGGRSAPAAE
jgi:5,5'-dehydrodivanillate O-demethylase